MRGDSVEPRPRIAAVSSPNQRLLEWADLHGIGRASDLSGFASFGEFDYLFSIVNYRILPDWLLRAPRRLAINYHDGPLPKYAGLYATTWAILNLESFHAITWHVMTEKVDAGDILKQVSIAIGARETASSLNFKCHVTAVGAFRELANELDANTLTRTKQDLSQRTYFGGAKKPSPDCLIPFEESAEKIDAFCRALDFGAQPNPIGKPNIKIGTEVYSVSQVEQYGSASRERPGTIQEFSDSFIRVATGSVDVVLRGLKTLSGREINPLELLDRSRNCE